MLKSQRAAYSSLAFVLDILSLSAAFALAWALRESLGHFLVWVGYGLHYPVQGYVRHGHKWPEFYKIVLSRNPLVNTRHHLWILYISLPAWLFFLNLQHGYDPQARRSSRQEFAICAYAGMLGTVVLMVFMVLAKYDVSRLLLAGFWTLGTLTLWFSHAILLPLALRQRRQPVRNMLVIGNRLAAQRFADILSTPAYQGSHLLGFIADTPGAAGLDNAAALRHLGSLDDLVTVLDREVVDEVVLVRSQTDAVSGQAEASQRWGDILELCLQQGRTVSLVDDIVPPVNAKMEAGMIGTMPTLVLHNTPQNPVALVVKSVMDRTIAALALIALTIIPVLPAIAIAIKLTSKGPIFFTQKRVGLNGRLFDFYKFRSMVVNAQEVLERMKRDEPERYNAINIMEDPFFKAKDGNDPRITSVGRFLRKSSLDELPQLWNVLRGDMSLVGPRPPLPKEVAELQPWQRRKLSVKGGLTCLWQVSGRNEITDVDEWMRLDLEYIDNWSLWLDVKLLFKTLKVLVKPRGAS